MRKLLAVALLVAVVLGGSNTGYAQSTSSVGWLKKFFIGAVVDDTTPSLGGPFDTSDHAINFSEGTPVASDTTTNIWVTDGNTLHVTGTTTITSFGTAPRVGASRMIIFDDALTLTHSANLALPGGANITTAAGDIAYVYADTVTQFDVLYDRVDGTAVVASGVTATSTTTFTNKTLDDFSNDVHANSVHTEIANTTGGTLNSCTIVHLTTYNSGLDAFNVIKADADAVSTMPAAGILSEDVTTGSRGMLHTIGNINGVDTSTDGDCGDASSESWSVGDLLYVSGTEGKLTNVRPTGAALVQAFGFVVRTHASLGRIYVVGAGRTNDVPNNILTDTSFNALVDIGTAETFSDADATPDVSTGIYWNTFTNPLTITNFTGSPTNGQELYVVSKAAITYDCTSSGLDCGSTDGVTASGDMTYWVFTETNWQLMGFYNDNVDLWTAGQLGASITSNEIFDGTVFIIDVSNSSTVAGNPGFPANECFWGVGGIICEGSTEDNFETILTFADTTSVDKTVTVPDETGTLLTSATSAGGDLSGTYPNPEVGGSDQTVDRINLLDTGTVTQTLTGTGNQTIDLESGNSVKHVAFGAITWTFSNPPDQPTLGEITLSLVTGGTGAQTFTNVIWDGGTAPVLLDTQQDFTTDFATDDKLDITAHGFVAGERVHATTTGVLPAGLNADTVLYVVNPTNDDFEVSLTLDGAVIDIADDGTGTHTIHSGENRLIFTTNVGGIYWVGKAPVSTGIAMAPGAQIFFGMGSQAAPSFAPIDNPTSGIWAVSAFELALSILNDKIMNWRDEGVSVGSSAQIRTDATTDIVPVFIPDKSDTDSGLVSAGDDQPGIAAGGVSAIVWEEASSQILVKNSVHVGLTANAGGGGVGSCLQLLSSFNEVPTVGTAGDSVCLPTAVAGYEVFIVNNDSTDAMDVFPFTGDDLGAGTNNAASLAAGSNIRYFAITGDKWEVM